MITLIATPNSAALARPHVTTESPCAGIVRVSTRAAPMVNAGMPATWVATAWIPATKCSAPIADAHCFQSSVITTQVLTPTLRCVFAACIPSCLASSMHAICAWVCTERQFALIKSNTSWPSRPLPRSWRSRRSWSFWRWWWLITRGTGEQKVGGGCRARWNS